MPRSNWWLSVALAATLVCAAGCSGEGAAAASGRTFPKVTGGFGVAPTIEFPRTGPPSGLRAKVLIRGSGPIVAKGELLVANYLGQIWHGKVFDSSFARKQPIAVQIGVGQVIPGWDKTLIGARVGSRILLIIPPSEGYGPKGNTQAGISGTDTIVFVIDLIGAYGRSASSGQPATPQTLPAGSPIVEGPVGQQPVIIIPKGLKQPTKQQTIIVDLGSGPAVQPGLLVLQYEAIDWTGKVLQSTWASGAPVGETVGSSAQASALDSLIGIPLGSRVLVLFPSQSDSSGGQTGSYAVVADLIAQPTAS
ncbi:MAG: FKBP-type peptidyl-prolyl cis-trans isomerase [Mycobacteriales bacterium]